MIKIILKRGSKSKTRVMLSIQEDPTPGTWGAHILLLEEYKKLDEEWIFGDPEAYRQLMFNTAWLEYMQEKYGELHCEYCGKPHLRIYHWKENTGQKDQATVDHFLSRARYPHLNYVTWNLRVACMKCNNNKKTKEVPHSKVGFPYPEEDRNFPGIK